MNLFRTLRGVALLGLAGAGLSGCLNAPDYSNTPEIEFKEIRVTRIPPPTPKDAVEIDLEFVLGFRDGDGDLGLEETDFTTPPFDATTGGRNNKGYRLNYFVQPYKKNPATGKFELFLNPPPFGKIGEYDDRYPRLNGADGRPAPLKGELRHMVPFFLNGTVFNTGDVFRFEISILDRGLHESNKITTSEVKLGQ